MAEVLSDGWFDAVTEALASVPPGPGGSAVVEVVVSGGGDGKVRTHWVVEDGRLTAVRPADGTEVAADAVVPQRHDALLALVAGDVDPAVAFMRGDLKPEGASSAVLAWLSALAHPECRRALAG